MHVVTGRLNKSARQHQSDTGVTFFVSLGEQHYNFKTRGKGWTNYDAALFAKGNQVQFYTDALVEGAVISVSGTGIIVQLDDSGQYGPKLILQDAKLGFVANDRQKSQEYANGTQQAKQAASAPPQQSSSPPQQAPQQQGMDSFDDDIPFD